MNLDSVHEAHSSLVTNPTGNSKYVSISFTSQTEAEEPTTISTNTNGNIPLANLEMQWDIITDRDLVADVNSRLEKHLRGLGVNKDEDQEAQNVTGSNKTDCQDPVSSQPECVMSEDDTLQADITENLQYSE